MAIFPPRFADLEEIAGPWALPSYNQRYAKRLSSSMEELQAFYDAVFLRADEVLAYCNEHDINDPPADVRALLDMLYSLVVVSFAVEVWKQPKVPDSGSAAFEAFLEPI